MILFFFLQFFNLISANNFYYCLCCRLCSTKLPEHFTVNSPVSPHLQQNGYASVANNQPNQIQQQQNYTPNGVQGTWKGSNTLTYTQSMQPPDPRSQHNNYCKNIHIYNKHHCYNRQLICL